MEAVLEKPKKKKNRLKTEKCAKISAAVEHQNIRCPEIDEDLSKKHLEATETLVAHDETSSDRSVLEDKNENQQHSEDIIKATSKDSEKNFSNDGLMKNSATTVNVETTSNAVEQIGKKEYAYNPNLLYMDLALKLKDSNVIKNDGLPKLSSDVESAVNIQIGYTTESNVEKISTETFQVQNMYPDLKVIQLCEQMQSIISSHTLVKTYFDECRTHTVIQANKACEEFMQCALGIDNHPLYDMVHQYHRAKQSCFKLQSRIRYLNSNLKRKKDSLWKSIKKEASAKGKCEDGYNVNATHSFVIKELDNDKYDELVKNLKEIEESVSLDAFNSYLEELMKLRIEHFLSDVLHKNSDSLKDGFNPVNEHHHSLKNCISVLFDCQRQNASDKIYVQTTRLWLQKMVSKFLQNENFTDITFLINHVIRCPSGIDSWASQFIQLSFSNCEKEEIGGFLCSCCRNFFLVLFLILNPIPFRDFFLKKLKDSASKDSNFAVLDSDGEEEEFFEHAKTWSENDILSLLKQIPIRKLYNHLLLEDTASNAQPSEKKLLKVFAYSTALTDLLFGGMEVYNSESHPKLFQYLNHLIRHILSYISNYWNEQGTFNPVFKISLQASYEKLFFHIVYQVHFKLKSWSILKFLPYELISNKMLWNIIWIFFSKMLPEEDIFSVKDVETKIQDDCASIFFLNKLKEMPVENVFNLLSSFEKMTLSFKREDEFMTFIIKHIFKISFVDMTLRDNVLKEGCVVLTSILKTYPKFFTIILQEIEANKDSAEHCLTLFKQLYLLEWLPQDSDICIISSWLLSSSVNEIPHKLARMIIAKMNWNFKKEGSLHLPYKLHKQIAILVSDAYVKFDSTANEWLVSRGIKQMLQFSSYGRNEDGFVHWAWNVLFLLKLHPLDATQPPWISIYDGYCNVSSSFVIDEIVSSSDLIVSENKNKHPSTAYLTIVMSDAGHSMDKLLTDGLDCLAYLVESEQYMAAIKSLYYILPFFVKNSEKLLDEFRFIKAINDLITADTSILSNLTSNPVIGAVLYNIASMIKYQIFEASKSTVEYAVPLFNLWIKILIKILHHDKDSKNRLRYSVKQIHFLMDVLMKLSYLDTYTKDCVLDLLLTICKASHSPILAQTLWKRIFSSSPTMYIIMNQNTFPDYPLLAWYILTSELKQKNVVDLWTRVQTEMLTQNDGTVVDCLKRASIVLNIDCPPLECLPIYRWAYQIVKTPNSSPVLPLIYQQFFMYFFSRIPTPNSQLLSSIGMKYFKSGTYIELLEQIKKRLIDALMYYKGSQTLPESDHCTSVSSSVTDKRENNLNICKILSAFHLWISDEFLHNSDLCLSALEPKYYPGRLGLLLNGDKNPWYDLLPSTIIKDELDQKFHYWDLSDIAADTSNESFSLASECLPDQLFRHIENYEMSAADLNYIPSNVTPDINKEILSSADSLMHFIQKHQAVIFDKAKHFTEQMKKLKQLNFNYVNYVPQEYENEDYKITKRMGCFKQRGKEIGCSGPATFILQVQKYKKIERICQKMDNNRADFVILMDQLRKLSVNDLCYASVLIENSIKLLSQRMKTGQSEEANNYKEIGVKLFYKQINLIEEISASVAEYSPSRLFFSSIIDALASEFIHDNEHELQNLANNVLNHPEAGSLALHHFNPNASSFIYFQHVYETLCKAVGKYSPSVLLALFSKIDFVEWLKNNDPEYDCRRKLFSNVTEALLSCGFIPGPELYPVYEILKKHFKIIMSYRFPEHFLETVAFLLTGIESKKLCIDIFYEAFFCFGCPLFSDKSSAKEIEAGLKKFVQNQQLPANQQIFVSSSQLSLHQAKCAGSILCAHFTQQSLGCQLFKKHALFIKPVAIMLAVICESLVILQLDEAMTASKQNSFSNLWNEFQAPFAPWLHPVKSDHNIFFPWSEDEIHLATLMFQVYTACLKHFHEELKSRQSEESVLSCVWNHYMQVYVEPGYRHYSLSIFHTELLNLPWHEFHPLSFEIEKLCRVLQSNLEESKQFLSKISLKVPWVEVVKQISLKKPPEAVGEVLSTIAKLLIISEFNCAQSEKNLPTNIFKELEGLDWHYLSIGVLEELLDLYFSNFENLPGKDLSNSFDLHTLQFLKMLCCMVPNENAGEYGNYKRILFLHKYMSAFSALILKEASKLKPDVLKTFLPTLLTEVDNTLCHGVSPDCQAAYAVPLVKEMLLFLNAFADNKFGSIILDSVVSWFHTNTQTPLLLPCIRVIDCLHSISYIVSIVECCIFVRFSNEILDHNDTNTMWHLISSYFQLPPSLTDNFIKKCIEENAFLALYSHLLCCIPKCSTIDQKKRLLQQMILWIRETKLKLDAEAKFLLLWDKILEFSISLVVESEYQIVKQELVSFCWSLSGLAEDRANTGILATFGFGQTSNLSVSFRFLCRVMAAFILYQIPDSGIIRMEQLSPYQDSPSITATKSLDNLKGLLKKKSYAALSSQIDYAVKCILDSKYNLTESRKFLKYFATILYSKESYLSALDV